MKHSISEEALEVLLASPIGRLMYPDQIWQLVDKHIGIPKQIIREVVPYVLQILVGMESSRRQQQ